MKTYSLVPLSALTLMVGMLLGTGLAVSLSQLSVLGVGGLLIVAAVLVAGLTDKAYRGCRIIDGQASSSGHAPDAQN